MTDKRINKYFYLFVLLFPALFFCLYKIDQPKNLNAEAFQFYTSVKSTQLQSLTFYKTETPLVSWKGPFETYKQIDYFETKRSTDENGFRLKIEHKGTNDTILFLGLNFLIDEIVYTLQPERFKNLKLSANAKLIHSEEQLLIVCSDSEAIWIDFNSPLDWENNSFSLFKKIFLSVFTLLFFLAVLHFQPTLPQFFTSLSVTLFLCFVMWYIGKDPGAQISINSFQPNNAARFYYNNIPMFEPQLSALFNDTNDVRKTQASPNKYCFYRINFPYLVHSLNHTKISYDLGLFHKHWQLNWLKPYQLNGNGLNFENHVLYTSENDPYLCLTTVEFSKTIKRVDFLRGSLYILFTLIIFILLLHFTRKYSLEKHPNYLLSFVFLVLCFCSPLFYLMGAKRMLMNEEKRLAYPFPMYSENTGIKAYAKQLDNYLKDQLPGRNQLIFLNNYTKYKVFSELATSPTVYFGKKNWMFYIGENVKECYENKTLYNQAELEKMTRVLEERNEWLLKQGIQYYIFFPRLSNYFYQENVGEGLHHYTKKPRLEQFLEYLKANSKVKVIDVYSAMLRAKQSSDRDLYFRSDSHWNLYGAYFAYEEIIKTIRKDFPKLKKAIPFKEIKWAERETYEADLAQLVSLSKVISRQEFIPVHPEITSSQFITPPVYPEYHSTQAIVAQRGKDTTAPSILMNRDSFSNFLMPYFSNNFDRQIYLWSHLFFPTIIEKEKPDIVICEMMERFLSDLLIDNPPLPLKELKEDP